VSRPILSVPHIIYCGKETHSHTSYMLQGKYRQNEPSSLFQYTISGTGIFKNSNGEHPVPAGSGFLCRLSDPETSYYYPENTTEPWHFIFFNFIGSALPDTTNELTLRNGPIFSIPANNTVLERMARLTQRNDYNMLFSESASIATRFFNLLFQIIEADHDNQNPKIDLVHSAKNHIQQYLFNDINAAEVARALNVSREHLSRVFSRETGTTLYQYILREKVLHACYQLKETTMSNKEISQQLGFTQASHFTRTFRRLMKMTPRLFRESGTIPIFPA